MKSPFPGMDPYLEQRRRDVHASLIIYSRDILNGSLPGDLRCRVEERLVVEPEGGPRRNIYPDVRVFETPSRRGGASGSATAVLERPDVGEPLIIPASHDLARETFLEIVDVAAGSKIITVIEILSLANKLPGVGQNQYLRKQQEIIGSDVNLVEIDLLRGGRRIQAVDESLIPPEARTPYRVCVRRGSKTDQFEYYPLPLREPLVGIRIPLRRSDADVILPLQTLLDQCYRLGRYDDIDYRAAPDPPLEADDAEWAQSLMAHRDTDGS